MTSVEQRIRDALLPIVPVVEPLLYKGSAKTYIVFNYDSIGAVFAESTLAEQRELIQVHLYLPHGKNPVSLKRRIAVALVKAGATYPMITSAGDDQGQHYVFETEMVTSYGPADD